jgi:hypothetical protein
MTLELNDVVARICTAESKRAVVIERVRHWAKRSILRATTPGQGGVRKFHHRAVLGAALLDVLTDSGIQPVQWDLRVAFYQFEDIAKAWAAGTKPPSWLQITFMPPRDPGTRGWVVVHSHIGDSKKLTELTWASDNEASLVIDTKAILTRLQWGPEDQQAIAADTQRRSI